MWAEPERLYTGADVGELDRIAITRCGIPGLVLMKRAGRAAFDALRARWPAARRLTVLCGRGNNAGDGYVVAALAVERGFDVTVVQIGSAADLKGDAGRARDHARTARVPVTEVGDDTALPALTGVVVDALLGTGIRGAVRPAFRRVIEAVNASGAPVLAVDVPSGVSADSGQILGAAVRAELTVSFIGAKRGLYTGAAVDHTGTVRLHDLDVPAAVYEGVDGVEPLDRRILGMLPRRRPSDHKGRFGHVLVIGGDEGMGGAVAMAAEAALRLGAGLVSVATRPVHVGALLARRPELMVRGLDSHHGLDAMLERSSMVIAGPGLGRAAWGRRLLDAALASSRPLVLDADALNLIAAHGLEVPAGSVLTPHPGEAARLLECPAATVQDDRFAALDALLARFPATVVLKGAGTLIGTDTRRALCLLGNPGLATPGSGDVLTGVIGGLLAQGLAPFDAARLGVTLHAAAGDAAARGRRHVLATDLMPHLDSLADG